MLLTSIDSAVEGKQGWTPTQSLTRQKMNDETPYGPSEEEIASMSYTQSLRDAASIQKRFLPKESPNLIGYSFFGYCSQADYVGGDYYDYIELANGRILIVIADILGHGLAAAMLMSRLSAEVHGLITPDFTPALGMSELNSRICRLGADKFITLIMVVLNPTDHEVTIVNAGHDTPILLHADGTIRQLGNELVVVPLGIIDDVEYEPFTMPIDAGDMFLMFTDGITEAVNPAGMEFGMDGISKVAQQARGSAMTIGQAIVDRVYFHIGSQKQDDDMCLVCFGRNNDGATDASTSSDTLPAISVGFA